MSLSICAECITRLRLTSQPGPLLTRSFSATPTCHASPKGRKLKRTKGAFYRQQGEGRQKSKPRVIPKLPAIGERKALRKRIVLSNTNALDVHGMKDLALDNMADENQVGQILGLNGELIDQLRAVRAFKPTQNWNIFRKPGTLMRRESVELGWTMRDVRAGFEEDRPRTVRRIVDGDRSTGKSLMLLQAMSMGFLNDWVVINVPEGIYS
jgi:small subunit ribosomal protein S29